MRGSVVAEVAGRQELRLDDVVEAKLENFKNNLKSLQGKVSNFPEPFIITKTIWEGVKYVTSSNEETTLNVVCLQVKTNNPF